ncbi:hypothetical protein BG015_002344 [Linnemannia schmuckeri]|uniref:Uncharacterized protein n=1 Tax=Linnemannia schmuckeri TaxID=64567 RepID=A0A9P5RR57_9FUNG|nr:hypothetical protein BG015_002344 [Linnemannia schmuckeri]
MEKRTPFDRPGNVDSHLGEHYVQHSASNYDFMKRTFKSVGGTIRGAPHNIGGEGDGGGDLRKRHDPSSDSSTIGRTVKRAGEYNPSDPQGGYGGSRTSNISRTVKRGGGYNPSDPQGGESGGGYGDGGYGDDLKKRSSISNDTFRKRGGGLEPVDPFEATANGDADV